MPSFLNVVLLWGAAIVGQTPDAERDRAIALATQAVTAKRAPEATLQVAEIEAVDWPDASLGCAEKGTMYAQMIVPGYRVVLESGGTRHEVHVGQGRAVMCGEPPAGSTLTAAAQAYARARRELARALALDETSVKVKNVRPVKASDPSPCDTPADDDDAPKGDAFWVDLEAGGKTYLYRADAASARRCDPPPRKKK